MATGTGKTRSAIGSDLLAELKELCAMVKDLQGQKVDIDVNTSSVDKGNKKIKEFKENVEGVAKALGKGGQINYFATQEKMIEHLTESWNAYNKAVSADEKKRQKGAVMRWANAYRASGYDNGKIDPEVFKLADEYYASFNNNGGNSQSIFSIEDFREVFQEALRQAYDIHKSDSYWANRNGTKKAAKRVAQQEIAAIEKQKGREKSTLSINDIYDIDESGLKERIQSLRDTLTDLDQKHPNGRGFGKVDAQKYVEGYIELEAYLKQFGKSIPKELEDLRQAMLSRGKFTKAFVNLKSVQDTDNPINKNEKKGFSFSDARNKIFGNDGKKGRFDRNMEQFLDNAAEHQVTHRKTQDGAKPAQETRENAKALEEQAQAQKKVNKAQEESSKSESGSTTVKQAKEATAALTEEKEAHEEVNRAKDTGEKKGGTTTTTEESKKATDALKQQAKAQEEVNKQEKESSSSQSSGSAETKAKTIKEQYEDTIKLIHQLEAKQAQLLGKHEATDNAYTKALEAKRRADAKGGDFEKGLNTKDDFIRVIKDSIKEKNYDKAAAYLGLGTEVGKQNNFKMPLLSTTRKDGSKHILNEELMSRYNEMKDETNVNLGEVNRELNEINQRLLVERENAKNLKMQLLSEEGNEEAPVGDGKATKTSTSAQKPEWQNGLNDKEIKAVEVYIKRLKTLRKEAYDESQALEEALNLLGKFKSKDVAGILGTGSFNAKNSPESLMLAQMTGMPVNQKDLRNQAIRSINPEVYDQLVPQVVQGTEQALADVAEQEQVVSDKAKELANTITKDFGIKGKEAIQSIAIEIDKIIESASKGETTSFDNLISKLSEYYKLTKDEKGDLTGQYDQLRAFISKSKIHKDSEMQAEFGDDWNLVRNTIGSRVVSATGGSDIMTVLREANDALGTTFDLTTSNADGWRQLYEALQHPPKLDVFNAFRDLATGDSVAVINMITDSIRELGYEIKKTEIATDEDGFATVPTGGDGFDEDDLFGEATQQENEFREAEEQTAEVIDRNNQSLKERIEYLKQIGESPISSGTPTFPSQVDTISESEVQAGQAGQQMGEQIADGMSQATESVNAYREALNKSFDTRNKQDATSQLRAAYNEYQKYFGENGSEVDKIVREQSDEARIAAYNYSEAYKEALKKEISDSNFSRYRISDFKKYTTAEDVDYTFSDVREYMQEQARILEELGNPKLSKAGLDALNEYMEQWDVLRARKSSEFWFYMEDGVLDQSALQADINYLQMLKESLKDVVKLLNTTSNETPVSSTADDITSISAYYGKYEPGKKQKVIDELTDVAKNQVINQITRDEPSKGFTGQISTPTSSNGISQQDIDKINSYREILQKLGYTLDEIKWDDHTYIASAKIIPIDENAVKTAEEMRRILFDIRDVEEQVPSSPAVDQHKEEVQAADGAANAEEKLKQKREEAANAGNAAGSSPVAEQHREETKAAEDAAKAEEELANKKEEAAKAGDSNKSASDNKKEADAARDAAKAEEEKARARRRSSAETSKTDAQAESDKKAAEAARDTAKAGKEAESGINAEGNAAKSAKKNKDDMTRANQNLADSMRETGKAGKEAADGVKSETDAVGGNDSISGGRPTPTSGDNRLIRETWRGDNSMTTAYELSKGLTRTVHWAWQEDEETGVERWMPQRADEVADYNTLLKDTINLTKQLVQAQASWNLEYQKGSDQSVLDAINNQIVYFQNRIRQNNELAQSYADRSIAPRGEYTHDQYVSDVYEQTEQLYLDQARKSASQIQAEATRQQKTIEQANTWITNQLEKVYDLNNKYDYKLNPEASKGIKDQTDLAQYQKEASSLIDFITGLKGADISAADADHVTELIGSLKRLGDNLFAKGQAATGDLSKQDIEIQKSVLSSRIDTFLAGASRSKGDVSGVVKEAEILKADIASLSSGKQVTDSFAKLKALKAELQSINEQAKVLDEIFAKFDALGAAQSKVVNAETAVISGGDTPNNVKNMIQAVTELEAAEEEAKKAFEELLLLYASDKITTEQFEKGRSWYMSDDVQKGSAASRIGKEIAQEKARQKVIDELADSYKKLAEAEEKAVHGATAVIRSKGQADVDSIEKRQLELETTVPEDVRTDAQKQQIEIARQQADALKDAFDEARGVFNVKGLGFGQGNDIEKTWDVLIRKAQQYQNIVNKQNLGQNLTVNELKFLKELGPLYEQAAQQADRAGESGEKFKAIMADSNQNIADQTIGKYKNIIDNFIAESDKMPKAYNEQLEILKQNLDKLRKTEFGNKQWYEAIAELDAGLDKINTDMAAKPVNQGNKDTLNRQMSEWMAKNTKAGNYADQVKLLQDELKSVDNEGHLQSISRGFDNIRASASQAGKVGKTFADGLINRFKSLGQYLLSFASFYRIIGMFKQAFNVVKELDTGLTEVRKVSKESFKSLKQWQKGTFDMADSVGGTASQIESSTAAWLRLGKSFTEAQEAAKASVELLNVSEFTSIDDATTSLVSMRQAFEDLTYEDFIDKLNAVGDNFSSSTDQLSTGMQNVSAVLKTAGNDIDQSLALLTAANDITQDMSKASMGVRTIALRIAGTEEAKQELEDLGEDVSDFVVQTQSKVDAQVRKFTATEKNPGGISVLDNTGRLRDTYDILLDIADVYDDIVKKDKQYGTNTSNALLELLAGKTRSNILASILQNPDLLRNAFKTAQEAAGTGQHELEIYLDSIEAHSQKLTNAVQELSFNALDSEGIKIFIDLLTSAVQVASKLVDVFGGLNTAVGTFGGLIISALGPKRIASGFKNFFANYFGTIDTQAKADFAKMDLGLNFYDQVTDDKINVQSQALREYADSLTQVQKQSYTAAQAMQYFKVSSLSAGTVLTTLKGIVTGFLKTMVTMGITMLASFAFGKIVEGIDNIIHRTEKIIEKGKEANNAIEDAVKSLNDAKDGITKLGEGISDKNNLKFADSVEEISKKYAELHDGVNTLDNQNKSLSTEKYQEYLDLCNSLAKQSPGLVKDYDSQGNAILDLGNNADTAAASIMKMYEAQKLAANVEIGANAQASYEGAAAQISDYEKKNGSLGKQIDNSKEAQAQLQNIRESGLVSFNKNTGSLSLSKSLSDSKYGLNLTEIIGQIQSIYSQFGLSLNELFKVDDYESFSNNRDFGLAFEGMMWQGLDAYTRELIENQVFDLISGKASSQKTQEMQQQFSMNDLYIKDQKQQIQNIISQYLSTSDIISDLPSQFQDALIANISTVDLSKITTDYDNQIIPFIYGELIEPIYSMAPETQEALNSLFEISPSDKSAQKYREQILDTFNNIFGDDHESAAKWADLLGFSSIFKEIQDMQNGILTELGGRSKIEENDSDAYSQIMGLSLDDLRIYADLVRDNVYTTWEQLYRDFQKQRRKYQEKPTNTLKDLFNLEDFDDGTYTSNLSAISSALASLRENTTLTYEEMAELQKTIPEITDFSEAGIMQAGSKALKDYITYIKDAAKDLEFTDQGQEQFDTYLRNLAASYVDVIDVQVSALNTLDNTLISKYKEVGMNVPTAREEIKDVESEIKDALGDERLGSEYADEIMFLLSVDGTLANGDIEAIVKQWDAYDVTLNVKADTREAEKAINVLTSERTYNEARKALDETTGKIIGEDYYNKEIDIANGLIEQYRKEITTAGIEFGEIINPTIDDKNAYETKVRDLLAKISEEQGNIYEAQVNIKLLPVVSDELLLESLKNEANLINGELTDANNKGIEVTKEQYQAAIDNANAQKVVFERLRTFYSGLATWANIVGDNTHFQEWSSKANEMGESIISLDGNIVSWGKSMEEIDTTHLQNELTQLKAQADTLSNSFTDKTNTQKAVLYVELQMNADDQKKNLEKQRQEIIDNFDTTKYKFNDPEYQEYLSNLREIDSELLSLANSQREWTNELLNIPLDGINKALDQYETRLNRLQDNINLKEAKGGRKSNEDFEEEISINQEELMANRMLTGLSNAKSWILRKAGFKDLADEQDKETEGYRSAAVQNQIDIANSRREQKQLPVQEITDALDELERAATETENSITKVQNAGQEVSQSLYTTLQDNADDQIGLYNQLIENAQAQIDSGVEIEDENRLKGEIATYQDAIFKLQQSQLEWEKASREAGTTIINQDINRLTNEQADIENAMNQLRNSGVRVSEEMYQKLSKNYSSQALSQRGLAAVYAGLAQSELASAEPNMDWVNEWSSMAGDALSKAIELETQSQEAGRGWLTDELTEQQNVYNDLQTEASKIEEKITKDETKHQKVSNKRYDELIKNGDKQIKNLESQRKTLVDLQASTDKGTDAWRDYQSQIEDVESSIRSMENSQIGWFETMTSSISTNAQELASTLGTAFSELTSDTGLSIETMDSLVKQFSDLTGIDASKIFYESADGMKLNTIAAEALVDAEYKLQTSNLRDEIERQNNIIERNKNLNNEAAREAVIAANQRIDAAERELSMLQALYDEQKDNFTNYQKFQRAQSTENAGSRYEEMQSYWKTAQENFGKGLTGTDEFRAYVQYFDQWGEDTVAAYNRNKDKITRYMTEDFGGPRNFLNDLVAKGYATTDGNAYSFTVPDIEKTAADMGMSVEWFRDMLGRLEDYGATNDWVESELDGIEKMKAKTQELAEARLHYMELQRQGASDDVLADQQKVIDTLTFSLQNLETNTKAVMSRTGKITSTEIQNTVKDIETLWSEMGEGLTGGNLRSFKQFIQSYADAMHIPLTADFKVDYEQLESQFEGYNVPISFEIKEGSEFNADLVFDEASFESGRQKALSLDTENEDITNALKTINSISKEQLESIKTNDGAWDATYRTQEEALGFLADSVGLIGDERGQVIAILEALGLITEQTEKEYEEPSYQAKEGTALPTVDETKSEMRSLKASNEEREKAEAEAQARYEENAETQQPTVDAVTELMNTTQTKIDEIQTAISQCAQDIVSAINEQKGLSEGGNVDLSNRPIIPFSELANVGWNGGVDDGSYATIYGKTIANTDFMEGSTPEETIAMNFTPIMVDENGNYIGVMSEDALYDYAREILLNGAEDTLHLKMGETFSGENAIADADAMAQYYHELDQQKIDAQSKLSDLESKYQELERQIANISQDKQRLDIQNAPIGGNANVDNSPVSQVVSDTSEQVENLTDKEYNITLGVDDQASSKLDLVRTSAQSLDGTQSTVYANADVTQAREELRLLRERQSQAPIEIPVKVVGRPSGGGKVDQSTQLTGTMLSPAHVSGTAYNVLNAIPITGAFADGKVGLEHDEEALVNELGTESLIRDGQWFLIPGGMHTENLKKGDVVLNHTQTEDLIKSGKAAGHGKAYAQGSGVPLAAIHMMAAHAIAEGAGGGLTEANGSSGTLNTPWTNPAVTAVNKNTNAIKDNTKASKDGKDSTDKAKTALDKFNEWLGKFVDWIDNRIDTLTTRIERFEKKAEQAISYTSKNNNVQKAMDTLSTIAQFQKGELKTKTVTGTNGVTAQIATGTKNAKKGTLLGDTMRGAVRYQKQADKVMRKAVKSGLLSQKKANEIAKLIQTGEIDIRKYNEKVRAVISAYEDWYLIHAKVLSNKYNNIILFNCGKTLKPTRLQHKHEIQLNANAAKAEKTGWIT